MLIQKKMGNTSLKVPTGPRGLKGEPSCLVVPITANASHTLASYQTVGSIVIGNDTNSPFTAAAFGIYVESGSTGSVKILHIDPNGVSTTLYENTNITSVNQYNVEKATKYLSNPLSIVSNLGTVYIQTLNQTAGKYIKISGCTLYYQFK